jgi:ATP/maltotriose-dependent transcriptional regulator MalT
MTSAGSQRTLMPTGAMDIRSLVLSGDTLAVRGRLTSSHFVGRVGELAELELASRDAAAGHPVLILLCGESGVGKTRLVSEFEQNLPGMTVLHGECVESSDEDGELPYAPLTSALRPLVRGRDPILDQLSHASRSQLAMLIPGLGDSAPAAQGDDQRGQVRMFEALLELLDLLSDARPVALILEDMHWADRSTRTFTTFLARSLRQERLLLVLTYRTDELHRRHPLRPLLAELERLDRARRIQLEPFDRPELTEALTDILGQAPDEELIARLYKRSEGNPLYTEELLAAGLDGRGAAPQSLRDAFMMRIERLPPDAQRAARVVAVGRRLDYALLERLTGFDGERLNSALRDAVAEQVLITDEDDNFLFRHALLREALYDDLLPGERGELHLSLARALEQERAPDDEREVTLATTIANHYASAGDQPAALQAMVRAVRAAECVSAFGEAAHLAERALELWPRVPDAVELLGIDHIDLLAMAARAHGIGGDWNRREVLLKKALEELDPEQDRVRYSKTLARLGRAQWRMNRGREGLESAERALAMLPEDEVFERAFQLAWLARTRILRGRFKDALRAGEDALAAAIAAHDTDSEGDALNTLGMAHIALGDLDTGVGQLRRAIEIARANDDADAMGTAYANLADLLNLAGRAPEALATALEGLEAMPRRMLGRRDWMELTASEMAFEVGDWELSRAHLGPAPANQVGLMQIFSLLREAEIALGEGDDDAAAASLDAAGPLVKITSEPQWHGLYGSLLAELRRRRGDLEGARKAVQNALDELEVCTDDVHRIARVTAIGLSIEADFAIRGRDLRDQRATKDALERARIHMDRLRAAEAEGGPVERAWRAVGDASLARGRGRNDPRLWDRAATAFEELHIPYTVAIARWREAEAHVEAGDRAAAATAAGASLETAERLGAGWLAGEVSALIARARLHPATVDQDGAASTAAAEPEDPFGLTPRERQVLALVAEGATNRQIGAALFMAEKTASVHVSRILSKLDVQSRTQAAAVAHRLHLA